MRMISSDGYLEGITVFPNMLHALTLPLYLANHITSFCVEARRQNSNHDSVN